MLLKARRRKPNHLISVLNATQNAFFKERSWKIIGKFPVPVELNDSLNTTVRHLHLVWFQRYPIPWIIEQWKCLTWNTKAFLKEKCAFQGVGEDSVDFVKPFKTILKKIGTKSSFLLVFKQGKKVSKTAGFQSRSNTTGF